MLGFPIISIYLRHIVEQYIFWGKPSCKSVRTLCHTISLAERNAASAGKYSSYSGVATSTEENFEDSRGEAWNVGTA